MPRFLISRLSALGDVVCTLPVASSLKQAFPDAHITWVVDPRFAGIVECCTAVDDVVRAKPGFKPATWPRFAEPFDAILEMQGLLKSGMATLRAKAPLRAGYHWQREGAWLFSTRVLPDPTSFHIVDQYMDVARYVGGGDEVKFGLRPHPDDVAKATELLQGATVAINPGAGWTTKRWPVASVADLVDRLATQGHRVALIGGKGEADIHQEVQSASRAETVILAGKTSVRELVAVLDGVRVHVGGDTGSTHLAAALGKPAVGLYAITRPQRSCPYGQVERCHHDPRGLSFIEVDAVYRTVMEALA